MIFHIHNLSQFNNVIILPVHVSVLASLYIPSFSPHIICNRLKYFLYMCSEQHQIVLQILLQLSNILKKTQEEKESVFFSSTFFLPSSCLIPSFFLIYLFGCVGS